MSKTLAFIDLEATSNIIQDAEIIEIAFIIYKDDKKSAEYQTLVKPPNKIPEHIYRLTGISNKMVKNEKEFFLMANEIHEHLKDATLVAHNVSFDYQLLQKSFQKLGIEFSTKTICTLELSKRFIPELPSYSLENLSKIFSIEHKDAHRAKSDAQATKDLYLKVKETFTPKGNVEKVIHPKFTDYYKDLQSVPAKIQINGHKFTVTDIKKYFNEHLTLSLKNKDFLASIKSFNFQTYASVAESLLSLNRSIELPKWVLYVGSKDSDPRLYIGKYKKGKRASYYYSDKADCFNKRKVLSDSNDLNTQLLKHIREDIGVAQNILLSSLEDMEGVFTHILIKDVHYYSIIKSEAQELNLEAIQTVKWSRMSPLLEMKMRSHIKNFKNQIVKTESLKEIKKDSMARLFSSYRKKQQSKRKKSKVAIQSNSNRKVRRDHPNP